MTTKYISKIIRTEINLDKMKKNTGIYETSAINNISIGVSYEDDDEGNEVYIYNLFLEDEYINIYNVGTNNNKLPDAVLKELTDQWNILNKILQ